MEHFPFQIEIKSLPARQIEIVECRTLLRSIPGKRYVYDALWQDKPVIIKVFLNRFYARLNLKKEWKNLQTLKKLKINSPTPLFFGKTNNGQWALVTEKIISSSTALDLFNAAGTCEGKNKILELVCKQVALQNSKGVLQNDLHLGNFLIRNNDCFALDPAQMIFLNRPLKKTESIPQLAFLASYIADDTESVKKLAGKYFNARSWQLENPDVELLKKEITRHQKKYIRKSLKKTLRAGTKFLKIKTTDSFAVFDKHFIEDSEPHNFIKKIDSLMDAGQILKKGNTCYVSRISFNNKDIVVKRYNHKGIIHSLRITFKSSRAKHNWLCGHLLLMLGIATPKPLAFIEQRKGAILWKSWIITEFVDSRKLNDFLTEAKEDQKSIIMQQLNTLLERLAKNRITHGDLKLTNILISENGPVLTDLDSMQKHKWKWVYKIRQARDIKNPHIKEFVSFGSLVLSF